jgi:hypothetical protein
MAGLVFFRTSGGPIDGLMAGSCLPGALEKKWAAGSALAEEGTGPCVMVWGEKSREKG